MNFLFFLLLFFLAIYSSLSIYFDLKEKSVYSSLNVAFYVVSLSILFLIFKNVDEKTSFVSFFYVQGLIPLVASWFFIGLFFKLMNVGAGDTGVFNAMSPILFFLAKSDLINFIFMVFIMIFFACVFVVVFHIFTMIKKYFSNKNKNGFFEILKEKKEFPFIPFLFLGMSTHFILFF